MTCWDRYLLGDIVSRCLRLKEVGDGEGKLVSLRVDKDGQTSFASESDQLQYLSEWVKSFGSCRNRENSFGSRWDGLDF